MKRKYITPKTEVITIMSESMMINASDGHLQPGDKTFASDEPISYGGESDGDDFAKRYNAWDQWEE